VTNEQPVTIEGVDLNAIEAWMDRNTLGSGPLSDVESLAGGTQNILVRFVRSGEQFVLRRPPLHLREASNNVLRREARLLAALNDTEVRAPRLRLADPEAEVLGVVSYLMDSVHGLNVSGGLPEAWGDQPEARHRMGMSAVEQLAVLARQDHVALGLSDYGKPEGFLERQVARWTQELDSYNALEGYPGPEIPGLSEVSAWLNANIPPVSQVGIMHGDFHLANLLFSRTEPELTGIVDWEMSTIGDPLVDLGWLLATWPGEGAITVGPAMAFNHLEGFASPAELISHYAAHSQLSVEFVDFYTVLACFKLGIILEGTNARAFAGRADRGVGDLLHAITVALFTKALTYLD